MKKTLSPIAVASLLLALMPTCFAQNGYLGPTSPYNASTIYQPTMTAMSVFQAGGDSDVPIPSDPGSAPAMTMPAPNAGSITPMDSVPFSSGPIIQSPDMSMPIYQDSTTWNAFSPPDGTDPFLQPGFGAQASPYAPYNPYQTNVPPQGAFGYGANPAQPYRFGWQNRIDVSWLPGGKVTSAPAGVTGNQAIFGVDYDLAYGAPVLPNWVLNWTNQFAYRNWSGPEGTLDLPDNVFRFGMDFELETPSNGPFSVSLGVTPSINTDFNSDVWKEGFQLDGRGILFWKLDQYWTLGLGAMYWDRVNDRILPFAGLIYRDDYWEWQLMYPEAKVSLFLGNEAYWSKWAYVRAEYHVESYGVNRTYAGVAADDQIEVADYRVLGGFKMDTGLYSWFIEGGYVFDRQVEFDSATPGYSLNNGFIGQIGLRY